MSREENSGDITRSTGRTMLIAGWIAGLGLLSLLFSGVLEQQQNPNRHLASQSAADGINTVTLQRNRFGHYVATGSINGKEVEFLLDTGASDVSIPEDIAQRLGLRKGQPRYYNTANGTITAYATVVPRLQLGSIVLEEIPASINPQVKDETILLGMSFLKHLEFTQRGDTLIIRQYPPM